jgi:DHA1 family bicyclomycin/chloramphenicol resistance-like MFS transporter
MLKADTIFMTGLLGLLTAFGPVATDMYVPSMPDIGRLLAADASAVQLTLSAYLVGFAFGQVIYGPASDHYGRKPVLLVALAVFCAASLACAAAPNIETLIAARALQALGGSGAIVLPRAIVRDLYTGERAGRELSRMGAIMSFAPVFAPLIGGIVQAWLGWRANFIIIVAIGIVTTFITWRSLPETLCHRPVVPIAIINTLRSFERIASSRAFLANLGIVALSYAGLFAWISGSPFVLQNLYGLSPFEFSVAFAFACIGSLIGAAIAASVVVRIGMDRTIGLGTFALAAGGLGMIASLALGMSSVSSFVLSMALYHAGLMFAMPQAIACAMMPFGDRAGAASSLVGLVQQISAALVGAIVGRTLGHSAWPLASALATMGCLSLALWAGSRSVRREGTPIPDMSQWSVQFSPTDNEGRPGDAYPNRPDIATMPSA